MKYPIDKERYIQAMKQGFNCTIDNKTLQIVELFIPEVNIAYTQGLNDGKAKKELL